MDFCLQGYIDYVVLVEADVGETLTQASYNYKRQKKRVFDTFIYGNRSCLYYYFSKTNLTSMIRIIRL